MDSLGCRRPDAMTRVSEYMSEIVEYIQTIMGNNMAYESHGSVHFDTQAFRYSSALLANAWLQGHMHTWLGSGVRLLNALAITIAASAVFPLPCTL